MPIEASGPARPAALAKSHLAPAQARITREGLKPARSESGPKHLELLDRRSKMHLDFVAPRLDFVALDLDFVAVDFDSVAPDLEFVAQDA
jgi:hypothetical protein